MIGCFQAATRNHNQTELTCGESPAVMIWPIDQYLGVLAEDYPIRRYFGNAEAKGLAFAAY